MEDLSETVDLGLRIYERLRRREEEANEPYPNAPSGWELAIAIERLRQRLVRNIEEDLTMYSGSFAQMRALVVLHRCNGLVHAGRAGAPDGHQQAGRIHAPSKAHPARTDRVRGRGMGEERQAH
jgi:hypothetical protein